MKPANLQPGVYFIAVFNENYYLHQPYHYRLQASSHEHMRANPCIRLHTVPCTFKLSSNHNSILCCSADNEVWCADLTTKCIQAQPEPLPQHCAGRHPVCGILPGSRLVQALLPSDKPSSVCSTFSLATPPHAQSHGASNSAVWVFCACGMQKNVIR